MKRKLIKQGGSGLVAYIPKKWIDEKNLKAGDEISIAEEEGDLIISSETKEKKKEIKLDFSSEDPLFIKIIINDLYREGYDKMTLEYSSKGQLKTIKETINQYLLGFEISGKDGDSIILENVAVPDEEKQEVLLRRIFFILEEMFEIVRKDLVNKKYESYKSLLELKRKIGQYDNFSRRNISKKKFYQESSSFYWMLYNNLYLISHNLIHLYDVLRLGKKYSISENLLIIFEETKEFYFKMHEGFFKDDLNTLKRINTKMNKFLYDQVQKELRKSKGEDSLVLYYFGELSRLLYKTNTPLLGILLTKRRKNN
jgi:phosphate uptake regulator